MAVGDFMRAATTARAPPHLQMLITSQLYMGDPNKPCKSPTERVRSVQQPWSRAQYLDWLPAPLKMAALNGRTARWRGWHAASIGPAWRAGPIGSGVRLGRRRWPPGR